MVANEAPKHSSSETTDPLHNDPDTDTSTHAGAAARALRALAPPIMHTARCFRVPIVQPEAFTAQGLAMTAWAYAEVFAPASAPTASALLDELAATAVVREALVAETSDGLVPTLIQQRLQATILCGSANATQLLPTDAALPAFNVVAVLNALSHALSHPQTLRTGTPGQLATFARAVSSVWSELNVGAQRSAKCERIVTVFSFP